MKFLQLDIENFRGITSLSINADADVIVIAGPNGCGKSSIFDAIRLLKSVYGGYQVNELQSFFSEFQINYTKPNECLTLLQDKERDLRVKAIITLSNEEKIWLRNNASKMVTNAAWQTANRTNDSDGSFASSSEIFPSQIDDTKINEQVERDSTNLLSEIEDEHFIGEIAIDPDGRIKLNNSLVLRYLFGNYDPQHLGIIDFHGAQRTYSRERIDGITVNFAPAINEMRSHALYNYQNKYLNVKMALTAGYVKDLIIQKSGTATQKTTLFETLKELFETFFPGKEFLGPQPTSEGKVAFNVRLSNGLIHDIDDLSSGEKEVVYGYLRLRNTEPQNSVLLIDEPELHLNPRLIEGLPDFYHRHIGKAFKNQIWLVTHSDSILRQAVGQPSFRVYHMESATLLKPDSNQVQEVGASKDLERAIISLVGDLAVYRPGAKVVVLEGSGQDEIDIRIVTKLFSEFHSKVNLISGESKVRVKSLFALLDAARKKGVVPFDVFCITDQDFGEELASNTTQILTWDRFHIENYLLEPEFILKVMITLNIKHSNLLTTKKILDLLTECARNTLSSLVRFQLQNEANSLLVKCINASIDPKSKSVADSLRGAIEKSSERILDITKNELSLDNLRLLENKYTLQYEEDLRSERWLITFRGRDILREFCSKELQGKIKYEVFRDLIIGEMRNANFKPSGMEQVINTIELA